MVVPSKKPKPITAAKAFTYSIRVYVEVMVTARTILVT